MNYLAHLYLSGSSNEIKLGNFMGDWVKGRDYERYPEKIRAGILLHRKIDSYTDSHRLVKQSIERFRAEYRKYAGIIVDIIYDYFLAVNWCKYSAEPFGEYCRDIYQLLCNNITIFPVQFQYIIPRFVQHDRLLSYQSIAGVKNVLDLMSNYTSLPSKSNAAIEILERHYTLFEAEFHGFFAELIEYVEENKATIAHLSNEQ